MCLFDSIWLCVSREEYIFLVMIAATLAVVRR